MKMDDQESCERIDFLLFKLILSIFDGKEVFDCSSLFSFDFIAFLTIIHVLNSLNTCSDWLCVGCNACYIGETTCHNIVL